MKDKKISAKMRENAKKNKFVWTDEDRAGITITKKESLDTQNEEEQKQIDITFNSKLTELAKLQNVLKEKGGPSEDGKLFEEIMNLENNILDSYGLRIDPHYLEIIQFKNLPNEKEIEHVIMCLKKAATEYLLSDAKADLQILKDAQEIQQKAFEILPELKIMTHIYTLYVYQIILFKRKDTVENILQELKFVNSNPDILGVIGEMEQSYIPDIVNANSQPDIFYNLDGEGKYLNPWEIINLLEQKGVKYIRRFIVSLSGLIDDDDY